MDFIEKLQMEKEFQSETSTGRKDKKYKEFCNTDAKTRSYIIERLSTRVLNRVQNCVTAYQMILSNKMSRTVSEMLNKKLESLYVLKSEVGKDLLGHQLYSLHFHDGGDMNAYIKKFENITSKYVTWVAVSTKKTK